ncbi:TetR/AcrR family transcriptional regulator [Micromonospora parathelypteridis]|uniref:AcrR family transcriptional regulator n=1 Tax=Micromonospora parathelypteridis TaxID=1839617 RepID=A0A840VSW9_9ACTN|nr:TetR/AcrR family transcriptional regulator [Micromonospora parathelypteridis]MBB5476118.1 AcrR family transcriptional regulator [Micromonospora parathelypteridis]
MPKIVDPQQRRRAVADAVHAVVARCGLEAATLRNVADEAGLAVGSVRHYFTDHDELMIFAVQELGRRVGERVWAHAERLLSGSTGSREDRRRRTEELLAEFLPLDDVRRDEVVLRHTFTTAARTRPPLLTHAEAMQQTLHELVHRTLQGAQTSGGLPADLDLELESVRLRALLDGLGLQAALFPRRFTSDLLREVLHHHLDSLVAASDRGPE